MTNKTVAFTFTVNTPAQPGPEVTQVTLGGMPVTSASAKKASAVLTDVIKRLLPKLQANNSDHYTDLMDGKQFTVLAEMPDDGNKFSVNIVNEAGIDILYGLSQPTCDQMDIRSLAQRATVASPSKPIRRISGSAAAGMQRAKNPTRPVKATPAPAESHGLLYRIFAAIGNFFKSFFSSETNQHRYEPLIPKNPADKRPQASYGTSHENSSAPITKLIDGIHPLRNGNNICFINAVFQALANAPAEIKQAIIAAHEEKIAGETGRIEELGLQCATDESTYLFPWWSRSPHRKTLEAVIASREASITLNQALRTYDDPTKESVYLRKLRGFIPDSIHGARQEDASELVVEIFAPVIDLLKTAANPQLLAQLRGIIHNFGEEKELVRQMLEGDAAVARDLQLQEIKPENLTQLPSKGLRKEVSLNSVLPFALEDSKDGISLQAIVNAELTMQKPKVPDGSAVYVDQGVRGDYEVSQKRNVIESLGNVPPEFVMIHLKRFRVAMGDASKIDTPVELPQDNPLKLTVNGLPVNYEIQSIVCHTGSISGGHYFSYVRKNGGWFVANDSRVGTVEQLPEAIKSQAYMVFLKRIP